MSESKVIPLGRLHAIPEANPEIIEELERLLEQARSGEMRGFVGAYIDGGEFTHTIVLQGSTRSGLLAGATVLLQHRIVHRWEEA